MASPEAGFMGDNTGAGTAALSGGLANKRILRRMGTFLYESRSGLLIKDNPGARGQRGCDRCLRILFNIWPVNQERFQNALWKLKPGGECPVISGSMEYHSLVERIPDLRV
jgi:hypothetical protein